MLNVKKKPSTYGYGEVLRRKEKEQSWKKTVEIKKKEFHQHEKAGRR